MVREPKKKRKINKRKLIGNCVAIGAIGLATCNFAIITKHAMSPTTVVEAKTITVEVPVLADSLPELAEVVYYDIPLSYSLQRYIYEICADEDVPVSLVLAMIEVESKFDPEAISDTDDYGLMQINEINHAELASQYRSADMLNSYQNVYCGIKIIGSYLEKYGTYEKALMAYNMGEYGATKAWANGITSTVHTEMISECMAHYEVE